MAQKPYGSQPETSWYRDEMGRKRWHRNDEVAAIVKQLGEYLIICGYPEERANRYAVIAHSISRWPEVIDSLEKLCQMLRDGKLAGIRGIGPKMIETIRTRCLD